SDQLADRATVAPVEPVENLSARCRFTDQTLADLRQEKVPEAVLEKLTFLKNKTLSRDEMTQEIIKVLDKDELAQFRNLLLDRADVSAATAADWPGFRGASRTGEVPEAAFYGWDGSEPRKRWQNDPVGPAWSSFCVVDEFVFTQEQRGNSESVVC